MTRKKKSDRPRSTHQLETAQGGTSQDTERIRPTEAHSHTGDRTGRDKSGHRKNPTDRDPLTDWRPHREGQVRSQKESNRQGPLTDWRPHREGQVRTQKHQEKPPLIICYNLHLLLNFTENYCYFRLFYPQIIYF